MSNIQNTEEITNTINNQPLINSNNNSNEITNTRTPKNDEFIIFYDNKGLICVIIILLLLALGFSSLFFYFYGILLGLSIFLMISIIIICICLAKQRNYIKLIKNSNENKLELNIKNYLGCSVKTLNLCLENTNFIIKDLDRYEAFDDEYTVKLYYTSIYIVNNFKNFNEIDIDKSNIVNIPIIFFYQFQSINTEINGGCKRLENKLNNFINSPINRHYLENIIDNNIKYKILSDHFYSYQIKNSDKESFTLGFIIIFILLSGVYGILVYCSSGLNQLSTIIGFIIGYLIFLILYISIFIYNLNKIIRVDFIFSKNYDRIFIGKVRNNGKSYRNKYIFEIDNIDRFMLDRKGSKSFLLKIIVSNNIIDIYQINNTKLNDIEKFVNLLNEKFKNKRAEHALILP